MTAGPHAPARTTGVGAAACADGAAILLFAALGRSSHSEGLSAAGVLQTAWPFLAGAGAGWLIARASAGQWPLSPRGGAVVWVGAVAGGMLLRRLTGAGTDPAFVVVATVFLGAALLGWRAAAMVLRRR
ncbi:MAG TPA: DUF3054 domain-containing protein [Pedococcus sp.]|uniref:DUF3054 domain-containing protein n=1 Tax=Pedococcus sp. TaxID=2860345 RepID=UPI002F9576FF